MPALLLVRRHRRFWLLALREGVLQLRGEALELLLPLAHLRAQAPAVRFQKCSTACSDPGLFRVFYGVFKGL